MGIRSRQIRISLGCKGLASAAHLTDGITCRQARCHRKSQGSFRKIGRIRWSGQYLYESVVFEKFDSSRDRVGMAEVEKKPPMSEPYTPTRGSLQRHAPRSRFAMGKTQSSLRMPILRSHDRTES
ncbi:MAG: hypothetical protein A4E19_14000 [Nitrospira sp. SG-bin1]|nr:MAG: hypothetical protein A4E19_14000 [Nitrospira sp. SG-bin1]